MPEPIGVNGRWVLRLNIFITGFSGSGKTTVSREVARRLGWKVVELDEEIVRSTGKSIEAIFGDDGEQRFRQIESDCLESVARKDRQVVSTGGGIVMDERNRLVMGENGAVVCLEARPETILQRLAAETQGSRSPIVRPMLEASDPMEGVRSLKAERQSAYALADWTVHTDHLTPAEAAEEVVRGWTALSGGTAEYADDGDLAAVVRTSAGSYPVWAGWKVLGRLGERVARIVGAAAAYVISDEGVYPHARRAQGSLEAAGIPTHLFFIPQGEASKTLDTAKLVHGWLADRKAERGHVVVAVGGGVVGDLAGFVAATYLRGMPLVQVPTSLLAMMDAAIGGKVAVDLAQGKNLVGAFHQPRFVLADLETLETLPERELTSGWAEAIKHGLILDETLLDSFEKDREAILALDRDVTADVIRRSVAVKANVVSQDERETLGVRVLLNYGHTIGHAVEAATGYRRFLHGEAVSVGMMGAAYISQGMGMLSDVDVERQSAVLRGFGLPARYGREVDTAAVSEAMRSDKKTAAGTIRWVLLDGIGSAITRSDVPDELVQETLQRLARRQPAGV
ncbi:MAG: 3-dehydroquinate synthase [Chloroflexi bacterium]|nr:3-dehydroquinate synthase [Chloroflexota bacterium]